MVLIDMAWRVNPHVRVFTLDTGRLPPETYTLFEEVRERYGIAVEFEYPDTADVATLVNREGPNLMYRGVDLRLACCTVRKVDPLRRKLATLDAWIAGLRREQWASRRNIAKVELDRDHGGIVKLNPLADWTLDEVWNYVRKHEVPVPRAVRPRVHVDRVRALHAPGAARRTRAGRALVVGAATPRRNAASTAASSSQALRATGRRLRSTRRRRPADAVRLSRDARARRTAVRGDRRRRRA